MRRSSRVVYLPGIGGHPGFSPAMAAVAAEFDVLVPVIPGFDGRSGFVPPDDHLGWISATWDAIDAVLGGDHSPVHVIGASVGGMLAAELAALRPEIVRSLTLVAPFGIYDTDAGGFDLYAVVSAERLPHLFAKGVPDEFTTMFAERGEEEAKVSRYLCEIAMASMLWPLGDRQFDRRLHRLTMPRLTLWGALDELLPVAVAHRWTANPIVIDGAGHLAEWDCPDAVADALLAFLRTSPT
jgi:pimeloyl-ACP methyl ester carboxylesterase